MLPQQEVCSRSRAKSQEPNGYHNNSPVTVIIEHLAERRKNSTTRYIYRLPSRLAKVLIDEKLIPSQRLSRNNNGLC